MTSSSLLLRPVAHIETDFPDKFGVPRQSGRVPELTGRIVFEPEFRVPEALRGIEDCDYLWLLFDFSLAHRADWSPTVRPPRLGGNRRVGVFATRSPFRPNPIGLSSVRLLRVEHTETEGAVLIVAGADLVSGTPIFDIKPYLPFTDAHPDARCGFAEAAESYRLTVECEETILAPIPGEKRTALLECLAQDPRPAYQDDPERIYRMRFDRWEVGFTVSDGTLAVREIVPDSSSGRFGTDS